MLHDDQVRPRAHDAGGFRQDHLDQTRILAYLGGEAFRRDRRGDSSEIDGAAFSLGDDLLRDDHDVASAQFPAIQRSDDQRVYIVAGAHHRQTLEGEKFQRGAHAGITVIASKAKQSPSM